VEIIGAQVALAAAVLLTMAGLLLLGIARAADNARPVPCRVRRSGRMNVPSGSGLWHSALVLAPTPSRAPPVRPAVERSLYRPNRLDV